MQALLYCNLSTRTVSEQLTGSAFTWPKVVAGDHLTLSLRFAEKIDGQAIEVSRVLRRLRASVGRLDARPEQGGYRLKLGNEVAEEGVNLTSAIPWDASAAQMAEAFNGVPVLVSAYGNATVELVDASYLVRFANATAAVPMTVAENSLLPISFVRVIPVLFDGKWVHELRLIQAGAAFTTTYDRVVPPAPAITALQNGGEDGEIRWNEIQRLHVPPEFRGTYQLRRGFKKSGLLSREDGAEEIAAAIEALADEDGEFVVTNPASNTAHIEFAGSMEGTNQALIEVSVFDAPEGDVTFTLSLNTPELRSLMREADPKTGELKLPFEVEVTFEDEFTPEVLHPLAVIRTELTLVNELIWEELATAQNIDWLRPPLPKDYIPFTLDQIATGIPYYHTALGNGSATAFVIDHNLNTEAVHVALRENSPGGRLLAIPDDYGLAIEGANSVTITLASGTAPPAAGALAVAILGGSPVAAFNIHGHTIAQIENLQLILDQLGAAVSDLQSLVPQGRLTTEAGDPSGPIAQWTLPVFLDLYPTRQTVTGEIQTLADITPARLAALDIRDGGLLPAVHAATVEPLPVLVDFNASFKGKVYQNQTSAAIRIPGGKGRRSMDVQPGEWASFDGRVWYKVQRFGTETSFYPADFNRERFTIAVNDKQLRLKKVFELKFGFECAILTNRLTSQAEFANSIFNTEAQWQLVLEWGEFSQENTPAITGSNFKDINWNPSPILTHRFFVTHTAAVHTFGCRISRSAANVLTCSRLLYGGEEGGASCPASANFAIRARLLRFDTRDNVSDPRGLVALLGLNRDIVSNESGGGELGTASIR
ncbi:MAG: hypothetical protein KDK97_07700 [Verrucomicrobiales bacterium]|nr:hypothetical protein [Verrucomicrobiales bacterium]